MFYWAPLQKDCTYLCQRSENRDKNFEIKNIIESGEVNQ